MDENDKTGTKTVEPVFDKPGEPEQSAGGSNREWLPGVGGGG